MRELIELAKKKPGEITYGTAGVGSAPHMNMIKFENMAKVKLQAVHYRGAAPALNDIIAGHINLMSVSYSLVVQPAQEKKLKVLGARQRQAVPALPGVPTVSESGVPGYEANTWFGLATTGGTPRDVVMKINAEVQKILADPAFQQQFMAPQMFESMASSPEDFRHHQVRSPRAKVIRQTFGPSVIRRSRRPRDRVSVGRGSIAAGSTPRGELHLDRRAALERLVDHAIALGELEQLVELLLRRVGVDVEAQPDLREADRRVLGDAERAAEVEVAFRRHLAGLERNVERGRDRLERHAGAGDQRLEQHVAGAQLQPGAAGRRMQAGDRERAAGLDLAGDVRVVERALGLERDEGGLGVALVAVLERRLHGAQRGGIHGDILSSSWPERVAAIRCFAGT